MKRGRCKMKMWMVEGNGDFTRLETRTKEIILASLVERDEMQV